MVNKINAPVLTVVKVTVTAVVAVETPVAEWVRKGPLVDDFANFFRISLIVTEAAVAYSAVAAAAVVVAVAVVAADLVAAVAAVALTVSVLVNKYKKQL